MNEIISLVTEELTADGLLWAFVVVAVLTLFSRFFCKHVTHDRMQWSGVAMFIALALSLVGGLITGGNKGLADIAAFSGLSFLGGSMLRDYTIVSLVADVDLKMFKRCAPLCLASLAAGLIISFVPGAVVAYLLGYRDAVSVTTIAAGALTFVVGPVTGAALGASSAVIAISVAAGLVKSVAIIIASPLLSKRIGLDSPEAAVVFGGLMGTKSGTIAGLAATDERLVPYGVLSTAFFTGLGCLICPSLFYAIVRMFLP